MARNQEQKDDDFLYQIGGHFFDYKAWREDISKVFRSLLKKTNRSEGDLAMSLSYLLRSGVQRIGAEETMSYFKTADLPLLCSLNDVILRLNDSVEFPMLSRRELILVFRPYRDFFRRNAPFLMLTGFAPENPFPYDDFYEKWGCTYPTNYRVAFRDDRKGEFQEKYYGWDIEWGGFSTLLTQPEATRIAFLRPRVQYLKSAIFKQAVRVLGSEAPVGSLWDLCREQMAEFFSESDIRFLLGIDNRIREGKSGSYLECLIYREASSTPFASHTGQPNGLSQIVNAIRFLELEVDFGITKRLKKVIKTLGFAQLTDKEQKKFSRVRFSRGGEPVTGVFDFYDTPQTVSDLKAIGLPLLAEVDDFNREFGVRVNDFLETGLGVRKTVEKDKVPLVDWLLTAPNGVHLDFAGDQAPVTRKTQSEDTLEPEFHVEVGSDTRDQSTGDLSLLALQKEPELITRKRAAEFLAMSISALRQRVNSKTCLIEKDPDGKIIKGTLIAHIKEQSAPKKTAHVKGREMSKPKIVSRT